MSLPLTEGDDNCEVCDGRGFNTTYAFRGLCNECFATGKKLTEFGRGILQLVREQQSNTEEWETCYRKDDD